MSRFLPPAPVKAQVDPSMTWTQCGMVIPALAVTQTWIFRTGSDRYLDSLTPTRPDLTKLIQSPLCSQVRALSDYSVSVADKDA